MSLLFFTKFKISLQNCSRLTLSHSISSWATCTAYGSQCKSLWRIQQKLHSFKWDVRACRRADLRGLLNMASLPCSTLSGAGTENGHPCGLLSFTDPSWCLFDTHNSRVLQLGASCLWNCWWKPRCAAVTDSILINNSTAAFGVALTSAPSQLNSKCHCTWWRSVQKWCLAGALAFKFQKLSGFFDTPCSLKPTVYEIISFFMFMSHMHNKNFNHF